MDVVVGDVEYSGQGVSAREMSVGSESIRGDSSGKSAYDSPGEGPPPDGSDPYSGLSDVLGRSVFTTASGNISPLYAPLVHVRDEGPPAWRAWPRLEVIPGGGAKLLLPLVNLVCFTASVQCVLKLLL